MDIYLVCRIKRL